MKMGIASSPSIGSAGAYPGCLIDIQKRAAEVEERAQNEVGDEERDALAVVTLRMESGGQRLLPDPHDEDENREGPERVDVVSHPEPATAHQRLAKSPLLHQRRRHSKADEREPGDPGEK